MTFSITVLIHCVKHLTETPFLLHQIEEKFVKLIFLSVLQFEKLIETGFLDFGPLHNSFINFLFWAIRMSPVTICLWFVSYIHKKVCTTNPDSISTQTILSIRYLNIRIG